MVHYVDARDGWDVKECECCFDRAVSYRAQRALNIGNIETFRLELHNMLPSSVPAAPPIHQSRAELEFSLKVPVQALGGLGGVPPLVQLEWKERNAPYQCVEAMLLEWMAEPRVAYPSLAVELGVSRQGQPDVAASTLVQVLGVKESADLQEGFGFFLQHLLSGGLEKAHGEGKEGTGGSAAETVHADGRGRGGAGRDADGVVRGSIEDIGRLKDGRMAKEVVMMPWMGSPEASWETGIRLMAEAMTRMVEGRSGMGGEAVAGAGMGRDGGSRSGMAEEAEAGSGRGGAGEGGGGEQTGSKEGTDGCDGDGDGDGGRDGKGEHCKEGRVYILDGNNASKTRVEEAAIEEARERLRRESQRREKQRQEMSKRGKGCGAWVRIYGSDSISAKQCSKDSPPVKVLPMHHPFRDLPSLLLRFGAIPKPSDGANAPLEWDEWPWGDEGAVKLPEEPSARCFGLGILDESEDSEVREEGGSGGEVRETPPEQAARGGGGKRKGGRGRNGKATSQGGGGGRGRVNTGGSGGQKSHADAPARALLPSKGKLPIVRCTEDAEFLVYVTGLFFDPPRCAQCIPCFAHYKALIPFSALIANFAFRPASVLFNRFVSIFPPRSPEFMKLAQTLRTHDPSPAKKSTARRDLPVIREQAERLPVLLLLYIALNWPIFILGIDEVMKMGTVEARGEAERKIAEQQARKGHRAGSKRNGGRGEAEEEAEGEDDGEVWEEVRTWCATALMAWPSSVRATGKWFDPESVASGLSPPCRDSKQPGSQLLACAFFHLAAQTRFHADVDGQDGADGGGVKLKNCSGCGKVAYCSRECQKAHWPSHKLTCPGRISGRGGGSSSSGKVSGKVSGRIINVLG
ncbi:unnamed protein product [Closterium sp. Naga37s-1]|nr:unnamed protein product [Closterium sp. Naga37s-1]